MTDYKEIFFHGEWRQTYLDENNSVSVALPYAGKGPGVAYTLDSFTAKKITRTLKLARAIREKGLEKALVEHKPIESTQKGRK